MRAALLWTWYPAEIMENWKEKAVRELRDFAADESGMGTVEIILIIVVLVGLVVVFRKQMSDLVNRIFGTISSETGEIIGGAGTGLWLL